MPSPQAQSKPVHGESTTAQAPASDSSATSVAAAASAPTSFHGEPGPTTAAVLSTWGERTGTAPDAGIAAGF